MKIAIASGKGGTGKTLVATNLAQAVAQNGKCVWYLDCDVEEPNGHIFLKPVISFCESITVPVPEIDTSQCTQCGECSTMCQYSALVLLPDGILTFPNLCHSCGGCSLACPERAIREIEREIGILEGGMADDVGFVQGKLHIGEAMAPPAIRAVKRHIDNDSVNIIDGPPGTACPVVETIKDADFCLLVTEPTPFGFYDLQIAVDVVKKLQVPFGIIINRCDVGDRNVYEFCAEENIPILMEIPFKKKIAELYSRGETLLAAMPEMMSQFQNVYRFITQRTSPLFDF